MYDTQVIAHVNDRPALQAAARKQLARRTAYSQSTTMRDNPRLGWNPPADAVAGKTWW